MSQQTNLILSAAGFVSILGGIVVLWGAGYALLVGGLVLFVAGGVGSAREAR